MAAGGSREVRGVRSACSGIWDAVCARRGRDRDRVRREIWRGILPRFDWWSIQYLPTAVRSRAAQRIRGIAARPDGTVEVWTCEDARIKGDIMFSHGQSFKLRKGQNGWQITESGNWIS